MGDPTPTPPEKGQANGQFAAGDTAAKPIRWSAEMPS
jgi:hypothetical protein